MSLSVPKPNVVARASADSYTQSRWSRVNGRSSSFPATMYCRSSGPMAVSAIRAWPRTGKVRRTG